LSENGDDIGSAFSPSCGDNDESDHHRKRKLNGLSDSIVDSPEPKRRNISTKARLTTSQDELCRLFGWQFAGERSLATHTFRCQASRRVSLKRKEKWVVAAGLKALD
jgi:hypothetical protein